MSSIRRRSHVSTTHELDEMSSDKKAGAHVETVESEGSAHGHQDKAAQFLKDAAADGHQVVVTAADNKRVLRKIDLHLLPILLCVYGLQSLDKTSLSYASVFGLIADTHLVGQQYSWTGSIVYVAQLIMQPIVSPALTVSISGNGR